jgi:hypothetical protein
LATIQSPISDHSINANLNITMKITHVVLPFALFGRISAHLNADGVDQDHTRAVGNDNGSDGNINYGNGGATGAGSYPGHIDEPGQLEEAPIPGSPPSLPGFQLPLPSDNALPLVSDFAAGNDDDEVDVMVIYKNNNGKNKAIAKALQVNHELRLGNIVAITATKKEIRALALDADIE